MPNNVISKLFKFIKILITANSLAFNIVDFLSFYPFIWIYIVGLKGGYAYMVDVPKEGTYSTTL